VTKNLTVLTYNAAWTAKWKYEFEMVGLATAAIPSEGVQELARALTVPARHERLVLESHPRSSRLDSSTEGVYLAGSAQGPKDIPQSVAQGSAAAGRAARVLNAGKWQIDPIVAYVDPKRCLNVNPKSKCTMCAQACPYGAVINQPGTGNPSQIIPAKCHGCGTCVAECPANAITQWHFTDGQILAQMHSLLADKPEEKVLAFITLGAGKGGNLCKM
jgi:heterodisulfide reductase subunit A